MTHVKDMVFGAGVALVNYACFQILCYMSEHMHMNPSSLILSAITLYSVLSFTKHMCIFHLYVETYVEKWGIIYPTGNVEMYS